MAKCEVCGNDYDKAFTVTMAGKTHTFDSFECAIHAVAPTCAHCKCKVVGHGVKAALAGGDSGPVILPGAKAAESKPLRLVAGLDPELKMPPEGPALSAADVGKLRAWIEQGADFGTASKTIAGAKRSDHWAF